MDGACDATMKIKACSGEDNEMRTNTLLGDFLFTSLKGLHTA